MSKKHCKECGTDFDGSLKQCPGCGCPAQYADDINDAAPQAAAPTDDEQDFNEHYEYTPFSEGTWFTSAPWPLSKYPRRAFAAKHPFLGWLFDPWHLTCRDASKQEQYDTANNIFYMFNLFFKANFYGACWTFFKTWYLWLAYVFVTPCFWYIVDDLGWGYSGVYINLAFSTVLSIALWIVTLIHYCFGMGNALHRYWPSFHKTWRRVSKRYWKAMKE